jgi:hypothetical protein
VTIPAVAITGVPNQSSRSDVAAPSEPEAIHPTPSTPKASAFFHNLRKPPDGDGGIARMKDRAAGDGADLASDPATQEAVETLELERYASLVAHIEGGRSHQAVLMQAEIDDQGYRFAGRHWRRAMDSELRGGGRALRERYDNAYVAAWDALFPGRFGVREQARLQLAEEQGFLMSELEELGLDVTVGLRLRRVWALRISADTQLEAALARELHALRRAF